MPTRLCCTLQVQGWCQTLCLNRARQRRQHRRHIDDWAHLLQHAMNADTSPPFVDWLAASPLRWLAAESPEAEISVRSYSSDMYFDNHIIQYLTLRLEYVQVCVTTVCYSMCYISMLQK
jgi:hypothetical protein